MGDRGFNQMRLGYGLSDQAHPPTSGASGKYRGELNVPVASPLRSADQFTLPLKAPAPEFSFALTRRAIDEIRQSKLYPRSILSAHETLERLNERRR